MDAVALKLDVSEAAHGDYWLITVDREGQMVDLVEQYHDLGRANAEGEQYAREHGLPFSVGEVAHLFPR
jgi:hypothetical protein